jgi:hypothetical protein
MKLIMTLALFTTIGCQSVAPTYKSVDGDDSFVIKQSIGKDILCTKDNHTRQWGGFRCFYTSSKPSPDGWREAVPTVDVRL